MTRVAVLDYGMGNLRSAEKALARVGARVEVTRDHAAVRAADGIVLPGVGAFPKAMEAVRSLELDSVLRERVEAGVPVLGICLGMQLLFESSSELGGADGLGLLPGRVERLGGRGLKLPQIGWNPVRWRGGRLGRDLPDPAPMYHVHSFAPTEVPEEIVTGTADYGGEFVSVVESGTVAGVQFHPEKSGPDGLALLRTWASARVAGTAA